MADLDLNLKISEEFVQQYRDGFFHEHPNRELDENGDLKYGDLHHFKMELAKFVRREANNGIRKMTVVVVLPEDSIY